MHLFVEVSKEKSVPQIEFNNEMLGIHRSLLMKGMHRVRGTALYISLSENKIPVIFPNGSKIVFTKIDY